MFLLVLLFLIRSKDSGGAYDLGELDQALFLYFDGHDPSNVQDQRRKFIFYPSPFLAFHFYPQNHKREFFLFVLFFFLLSFCYPGDSITEVLLGVTGKACSTD